jgi:polysaccharide biosynthesis transport protein
MMEQRQLSPYRVETAVPSPYLQYPQYSEPVAAPAGIDLRSYWLIFYKRRFLILVITLLVGLAAAMANYAAPKIYVASTQIRIDPAGPEYLPLPNAVAPVTDESYYQTEYAELQGAELAKRVIQGLHLDQEPRFIPEGRVEGIIPLARVLYREAVAHAAGDRSAEASPVPAPDLVGAYLRGLTVTPVPNSRLVTISFASRSPELAAQIANGHAREFLKTVVEARTDFYAEVQQFLEARLSEIKKRTEESEAALNDFRRRNRVLAVSGSEKENVTLDRLASLNGDYVKAQAERIAAEADYDLVKKRRYESLASVQRDPLYNSLRQELDSLKSEQARLAQTYQPKYPKMQELAGRIAELDKRLASQVKRAVDGVESQYLAAKAKEEALAAEVEKQKKETLDLNDLNAEYQVLARDAEANRELYKNLLARAKETNITQSMKATNVRVVADADVPRNPSLLESRRRLLMALVIGLCLGCGIAFGLEYIDNSIKTPEDAESLLQLPALAVIPSFSHEESREEHPHHRRERPSLRKVVAELPVEVGGAKLPVGPIRDGSVPGDPAELVVAHQSDSIITEAYRTLRTAVLLSSADKPPQIIQLVSSLSREGKTVTAVNTALTLAQSGAKVLLIDADLRRPRCNGIFQTPRSPGLVDVLVGLSPLDKCIRSVKLDGLENLFHGVPMNEHEGHNGHDGQNGSANGLAFGAVSLLPAGTKAPNPAEILGSQRMRELLRGLRERYDFIIIDSPPVLPVADSVMLATMVDGVLMVIKGQSTTVPVVKQAIAKLERVGARLLGSILNDVDVKSGDYYYYKGYYASYDYLDHADGAA